MASPGWLNEMLREGNQVAEAWDIGGQIRARFESRSNAGVSPNTDFIRNAGNDNDWLLLRQRFHVGWRPSPWLQAYVEARGSQAFSDARDPSPDEDVIDLHQAFLNISNAEQFPLTLKIGRQELVYGDQRQIGTGDWGNMPRSFDAAVVRYHVAEKSWIDLFTSRVVIPQDDEFNVSNDYDQFSGLYASSTGVLDGWETDVYFLARNVGAKSPDAIEPGVGGPSERDVHTYGTRLKSLPKAHGPWDFTFEAAGQFGEREATAGSLDLRGYLITYTNGYSVPGISSAPRIAFGFDYASGDSDPGDGRSETFEPLFPANHAFYGLMDLVGPRNLFSPRLSFSMKPAAKLSVAVDLLTYWLADDGDSFYPSSGGARNANGYAADAGYGSHLGTEIDVLMKYTVNPQADFQLGYAHFSPGEHIDNAVASVPANDGSTGADWVYTQLTLNF
ncbi:MAG: alginate export family protein [Verrucomicrobiota bacterium]